MAVELWYGVKPGNPGEQNVLVEIIQFLDSQPGQYLVLCNFHAGPSNEIDLAVLKQSAIFLVEVKHCWSKLVGGKEGSWYYERKDSSQGRLGNPYHQVRKAYSGWCDWGWAHANPISLGVERTAPIDFQKTREVIVIYPDLHPESEIDIGAHPVQVMGLQKFLISLPIVTALGIDLSTAELSRIPKLLKLTRWHILTPAIPPTVRLRAEDWQPPRVRMLVARGHEFSQPVLYLEPQDKFVVGRDEDCDLIINSESVSRHHAEIVRFEDRYLVRDLNSTNGTFVCFAGEPHLERRLEGQNALKNGSIVRFGQASYTLLIND